MDAAGLLKKQGWRGSGHSLDSTNKGLRKPLLISKKVDVLGVGINKHDVIADQWWMKAFDSSLKDFGTGKKSLLGQVKDHGIKRGGLYARFVQGEGVPGTIGMVDPKVAAVATAILPATNGVKRKADDSEDDKQQKRSKKDKNKRSKSSSDSSSSDEKQARRAAKKLAKAKKSATASEDTSDATTKQSKKKEKKDKAEKSLDGLSEDKRKQYEERAAAKGLTIQQYFAQRQVKNLEAKQARRSVTVTSASEPASEDDKKKKEKKSKKDKKSAEK